MAHSGKDLGADLYKLEQVAKDELPTVSGVYGDAIVKTNNAHKVVSGIPKLPEQFIGDHGSVSGNYGKLHDSVLKVLKETKSNLDDTAHSLHEAAKLYAENDTAASNEFHRLLEDRGEPKPE